MCTYPCTQTPTHIHIHHMYTHIQAHTICITHIHIHITIPRSSPSAINEASSLLSPQYTLTVPQVKPLSRGETLGCTAPYIRDADALVFVADGRFHMEAAMIRNPSVPVSLCIRICVYVYGMLLNNGDVLCRK